jgi:hypothetical protein
MLWCLFFQTSKPELNNLKVFSSRDTLLLRWPRWSSFITHTSTLFCHFVKYFFFTDAPVLRASVTVASPVLCARVMGSHVSFPPPPPFPLSCFLFPFSPLNYCNNSVPPSPKKRQTEGQKCHAKTMRDKKSQKPIKPPHVPFRQNTEEKKRVKDLNVL